MDCRILGGCFGLIIGLIAAGGYRFKATISSAIAGVLAGAICGYAVGQIVAYSIVHSSQQSLFQSTMYHAMIWGPVGAAISGAIAVSHNPKQLLSAGFAGLFGGIVGAVAYNTIASILYPTSNLSIITPATATERLILITSCAMGLGVCLVFGLRSSTPRRQSVQFPKAHLFK